MLSFPMLSHSGRITEENIAAVVSRYNQGQSLGQIARDVFGTKNGNKVKKILLYQGVKLRPVYKISEEDQKEIIRLYCEEGYGMKAISVKVLGVEKKSSIRSLLVRHGVEIRDQNEGKKLSPAWETRSFGRQLKGIEKHKKEREAKARKKRTWKTSDLPLFEHSIKRKESKGRLKHWKKRYRNDPEFRSFQIVRSRFKKITKNSKKDSTWRNLIGCTKQEFKSWLETQFDEVMTWDNQGNYWHIDHVVPCKLFDHSDPDDVALCWNYQNMRPLSAEQNMKKGARLYDCFEWLSKQDQTHIIKRLKAKALQYL